MSVAIDARGLKRVCVSCGIRFYDMNKRPVKCPGCGTEFTGEIKVKGRRGRAAVKDDEPSKVIEAKSRPNVGEDEDEVEDDLDVVSFEDVEEDDGDDEDEDAINIDLDDEGLDDLDVDLDDEDEDLGEPDLDEDALDEEDKDA